MALVQETDSYYAPQPDTAHAWRRRDRADEMRTAPGAASATEMFQMTSSARERRAAHVDVAESAWPHAHESEPARVLVVDDVEDNRAILARRLSRRGYLVTEAESGRQALDLIAGASFDVVLLDVMMPEMDGLQVLERVRRTLSADALPVIMCTANSASADIVQALEAGANDYVTKPVDFAVASARIKTQIERKRTTARLAQAYTAVNEINDRLEREILRRQQSDAQTRYLAYHDALTGLGNRVMFKEVAERALEAARLTLVPFAVFYIDLDGFKDVNDSLGHSIGDALLKALAARLRDRLPEDLVIARLGGDEFGILRPKCETADVAISLANDIISAIVDPFQIENNALSVTASVGIAIASNGEASIDEVLKSADLAMYSAKQNGRRDSGSGSYRIFDPTLDEAARTTLQLKSEMRDALANSDFCLHFQPIVSTTDRRVTAFEALIRWRHPTRGMIGPGVFIPVAESTRYIVQIGEWVLREACREAARWPQEIKVAVNLSAVQFQHGDIVSAVLRALAQSGLPPRRLELEITESIFLEQSERNVRALESLRGLGVTISMDDFGTGFSGLGYLRTFPFDKLKIDRSFVQNLDSDQRSHNIVRAIASLGRSFGMKTVAEGVETEAQYAIVVQEGCTEVQGKIYSMPLPADGIPSFIETLESAAAPSAKTASLAS